VRVFRKYREELVSNKSAAAALVHLKKTETWKRRIVEPSGHIMCVIRKSAAVALVHSKKTEYGKDEYGPVNLRNTQ